MFPVYTELHEKSKPRITKVITRSIIVDGFFFLTVAVFGYMSTLSATEEIVVNRPPLGDDENDMFMMVARLFVYISLVVGFPVNYNPFRNNMFHIIFGTPEFTFKGNLIMTLLTVASTCFISIIFP